MLGINIKTTLWTGFFLLLLNGGYVYAQNDSLLTLLKKELDYEMQELSDEDEPPYFMGFRVDDMSQISISASYGALISHDKSNARIFTPQVRVGSYSFDNTHDFDDDFPGFENDFNQFSATQLPLENNENALRHSIWLAVDNAYKAAVRNYQNKKNREGNKNNEVVDDFSKEDPTVFIEQPLSTDLTTINEKSAIQKLKDFSNLVSQNKSVIGSNVTLNYGFGRRYYISTEGSAVVQNQILSQLQIFALVKNQKGIIIPQQVTLTGKHPDELLNSDDIEAEINDLQLLIKKINNAPAVEPYAGPAILSPEASGVFFHEIFGHRVEGHRLEKAYDGQTFTNKIGQRILPKAFSVYSDPTVDSYKNMKLIGSYSYDDEGVKSQKVTLVKDGILTGFLMSRKPLSGISKSNGHGRAQPGNAPVSRQANLIVTADKAYSDKELRKKLITECKKQDKEYGYYFKSVIGGFTLTDRFNPNVFNIIPSEVYRVYVDGRPDELVVGAELIGTPLTMFSNIMYAGEELGCFSGMCGAESGYIPVSAVSPAILVKKIETQKGMEFKSELPLLPDPATID